jgi:cyanophycin synthetase
MLYPPKSCRIPIIAVTGTNGKTTTRLFRYCKNNGFKVGFTTSDGIYIQNHDGKKAILLDLSAEYILKDPTVEFAVLETARGGILRSGLGFSLCDIGYY